MKLNYKRTILVGFAFFLISAFWQAYDSIVPLILTNHFGLPQTASGTIMSLDNILAVFMLPLFGALSDKVCTRLGKRTPFILVGAIAAALSFVFLICVDTWQFSMLGDNIINGLNEGKLLLKEAQDALNNLVRDGAGTEVIEAAKALVAEREAAIEALRGEVLQSTIGNAVPLITFIGVLLVTLISMATFRSPAVALMPDVTVKPLRSKGNAIINLVGTAGAISVLVLGMVFGTSDKLAMSYLGYVVAVVGIMLLGLVLFMATVREKRWAREMEEESARLGLHDAPVDETGKKRKLSRPELVSLLLILASVALWYIGYNSITSKYSVYATNILFANFNLTLIIAQAAAIVSYIPVGIISSKLGRKKTILTGILMLFSAFLVGTFITPAMPTFLMYPIFVLAGIGWASINVNSFPMVVELARGGDVGKYTGYYYTASMAAQIVAPILSGILYDALGMRFVFFPFGALFVAFSFITMLFVRHGDAKPEARVGLEALDGDN